MDSKEEESKQKEEATDEAVCMGDLLVEEEAKGEELLSSCLDMEHIELTNQQVESSEQQQGVEFNNVSGNVEDEKVDVEGNVEIGTDGIAAIDADKESVLVQECVETGGDGNSEKLSEDVVECQNEVVGEKEYQPDEELHFDDSMFSASEERDPAGSLAAQVTSDVANVTRMVEEIENDGLEKNEANGSTADLRGQLEYGFTDEKDMEETRDGIRMDDDSGANKSMTIGPFLEGDELGTEEEQIAFVKDVESFCRENGFEFKPPKFYGEGLNLLKLWRAVVRLGGYDQVTSSKLWRQVGESFNPPKTCTTVSWTFRIFYEKALLEYERHKLQSGVLSIPGAMLAQHGSLENPADIHGAVSGRARRDSATRAMQGWHQHRLGNGEVNDTSNKEKSQSTTPKRGTGTLKRKTTPLVDQTLRVVRAKTDTPNYDISVIDVGAPADWVKINVQKTRECFEVYALVPGLLREEVKVQSDPAGRVVISGDPEQPDNPWGVTQFKKVVTFPSRIDPHQTSAVITLHGQLFVRAPFEQPGV